MFVVAEGVMRLRQQSGSMVLQLIQLQIKSLKLYCA